MPKFEYKKIEVDQEPRECGSCSMCCKLLKVSALQKPADTWCKYCYPATSRPCWNYEDRPTECVQFKCLWLLGLIPRKDRPDRTKVVLYATNKGEDTRLYVHEDVHAAGRGRELYGAYMQKVFESGAEVVVLCGKNRTIWTKKQYNIPDKSSGTL